MQVPNIQIPRPKPVGLVVRDLIYHNGLYKVYIYIYIGVIFRVL